MKDLQTLQGEAIQVELADALHELNRELIQRIGTESRPGAYVKKAAYLGPKSKDTRDMETQTTRLIAVQHIIQGMSQLEFKQRLNQATSPNPTNRCIY